MLRGLFSSCGMVRRVPPGSCDFSPLRAPFLERCSGTSVLVHLRSAGLGCRVVVSQLAARGLFGPSDLSSSAVCAFLSLSASLVSS